MSPRRTAESAFVAAIVMLLLSGTVAGLFIVRFIQTERWVVHTLQVQSAIGDVAAAVSNAGRLRFRYASTGDPEFLRMLIHVQAEPAKIIQRVLDLTADNPEQHESGIRLRGLIQKKIALYQQSIDLKRSSPADSDAQARMTMEDVALSDESAEIMHRMHNQEEQLLTARVARAQRLLGFAVIALATTFVLALSLLLLHHRLLKRELTRRLKAEREARLRNSQLEIASRVKGEFLANMSHEIRTPINGIVGMTELALDTELTPDQRQFLEMVKLSADSLLTVINDILDFSKIEAGKLDLDLIEFNIRNIVEETARMMALPADEKGLELITEVDPGVPEVLIGDPVRVRQVLFNLLGNAIKFTERGEVVVGLTAEENPEGFSVHMVVSDTGIGIPKERQQSIFEAFAQADTSTTRRFGGTGLGLTITSRLIHLMGGRIWVESELGQGSRFHCTVQCGVAAQPARTESSRSVDLRDIAVMIVDDNETNRRILKQTLMNWQMKPTLANGALEALSMLQDAQRSGTPFPLVITDQHMPGMDGFGLAEKINEDPELASTTILMLSSAGTGGEGARCREFGIKACLLKPVKQSELRAAIVATLSASGRPIESSGVATSQSLGKSRRPLSILLAEDNRVNQMLAKRRLEQRGHTVLVVNNGLEVLAQLETSSFDLVLMDVQMPEMDGFEATRAIREREQPSGNHLPIIALTANAMAGDQERCLAAGMDGYLSKPLKSRELFDAIERLELANISHRDAPVSIHF